MFRDADTTVSELRRLIADFVAARDWDQFHTPKNLAMSAAIEAAELMEHFQWLTPAESLELAKKPETLTEIGEELADVCCYLLALANTLGIDVAAAIEDKMRKNERKYPADEFQGRFE
jgi:NTP pyrophosphatase (non-canonical NTP hydrolase)